MTSNGREKKGALKSGRKSKAPADKELLKMYESLTAREIGEKYSVSMGCVRRWIHDAKIRQGVL